MDSPESRFHLSCFQMDIAGVNNKNKVNICWENINMGLLNPTQGRERNFFHSLTRFVKPLDGPIWGIKYLLLPLMPINTRDHNGRLNYTSFIPNSFHCTGDWNCLHFSCSYKDQISNQIKQKIIGTTTCSRGNDFF